MHFSTEEAINMTNVTSVDVHFFWNIPVIILGFTYEGGYNPVKLKISQEIITKIQI
jgi:hypothetical protein